MGAGEEDDVKSIIPSKTVAAALINVKFSHFYDHESSQRRLLDDYKKKLKLYFGKKGENIYMTNEVQKKKNILEKDYTDEYSDAEPMIKEKKTIKVPINI
jgi:hypothetical protein